MQEKFSRTRLYLSNKSHVLGVEAVLNELVTSFQHNGTLEDIEKAQDSMNRADFFRQIEKMQRKTALIQGDRSYPDLQLLGLFADTGTNICQRRTHTVVPLPHLYTHH